jgi:hypothetical protein
VANPNEPNLSVRVAGEQAVGSHSTVCRQSAARRRQPLSCATTQPWAAVTTCPRPYRARKLLPIFSMF